MLALWCPLLFGKRAHLSILLVAMGTLLLIASSYLVIPFWPVPVTLQTLALFLLATILRPALGFASGSVYIALALCGLPVLAPGTTIGPAFGYALAFPFAIALAAALPRNTLAQRIVAFALADVLVFTVGAVWLRTWLTSWQSVWLLGVMPFLLGDAAKILFGALCFGKLSQG